ncbi:MAG TPA: hypothetical protein VMU06_08355 [Stellaceae bacterium]|nr:hypothetical protein [Stellaceae bacterium]
MASLSFIRASKLAELLQSADPEKKMYVRILNTTQLGVGLDPLQPMVIISLSKETIGPTGGEDAQPTTTAAPVPDHPAFDGTKISRRSGDYWFEISGKRIQCGSLRQLLAEALKALEKKKPGTLDNLSRIRGRSRRIVARDANQLFDKAHLVKEYAERLDGGWYFGTNNSARETGVWLQRAAECAGFKPGSDFKTNL